MTKHHMRQKTGRGYFFFFGVWSNFNKLKTPDQKWLWTCPQCWVRKNDEGCRTAQLSINSGLAAPSHEAQAVASRVLSLPKTKPELTDACTVRRSVIVACEFLSHM